MSCWRQGTRSPCWSAATPQGWTRAGVVRATYRESGGKSHQRRAVAAVGPVPVRPAGIYSGQSGLQPRFHGRLPELSLRPLRLSQRRSDDLVHWLPARLSVPLITLAAALLRLHPRLACSAADAGAGCSESQSRLERGCLRRHLSGQVVNQAHSWVTRTGQPTSRLITLRGPCA